MASEVGPAGQIIIEQEIRDRLGIGPGWRAIQQLVDDHVEIYFVPPEHDRSLFGVLTPYIKAPLDDGSQESWDRIEEAIAEAIAREASREE